MIQTREKLITPMCWLLKGKVLRLIILLLMCMGGFAVNAQTDYFRVVNGVPHLPVVANTAAVSTPLPGALVYSQQDNAVRLYTGSAWDSFCSFASGAVLNSATYFRVVNGIPCLPVQSALTGAAPSGTIYYPSDGAGLRINDGSNWKFVGSLSSQTNIPTKVTPAMGNLTGMAGGFILPVLTTVPTGVTVGALYIKAATGTTQVYNGSSWIPMACNCPPQVTAVRMEGTLACGYSLNVGYVYYDREADAESGSTFQWYRATYTAGSGSVAISGATASSYLLTLADVGKYIGVTVTPRANAGDLIGSAASSGFNLVAACPSSITVAHTAGTVAPETQTITYGIVATAIATAGGTGTPQCWITQNLGAYQQANSATDGRDLSAGWYWQFNRAQGFALNSKATSDPADDVLTPATTWITDNNESSDWLPANDPCTLLLGVGWRLPTDTEWTNADGAPQNWGNYNNTYASVLKLHSAGVLDSSTGLVSGRAAIGCYWSSNKQSNTWGKSLFLGTANTNPDSGLKSNGYSVRCLRSLY